MSNILFVDLMQMSNITRVHQTHKATDQHQQFSLYDKANYHKTEKNKSSFAYFLKEELAKAK